MSFLPCFYFLSVVWNFLPLNYFLTCVWKTGTISNQSTYQKCTYVFSYRRHCWVFGYSAISDGACHITCIRQYNWFIGFNLFGFFALDLRFPLQTEKHGHISVSWHPDIVLCLLCYLEREVLFEWHNRGASLVFIRTHSHLKWHKFSN